MPPVNDTSFWILQSDETLTVLQALCKVAPTGATLAFEGVGAREALSPAVAAFSVSSGFNIFRDSKSEGTELFEIRPSPPAITALSAHLKGKQVCDFFYHLKFIENSGRIWAWHHDAGSGGFPYLNPRIDEDVVAALAKELRCEYVLQKDGMWGWDYCLEKPANQALQHNDPSCHAPCMRTCRASRGRG